MRAWQFQEVGKPLQLVELPDPTPGPGEVVIAPRTGGLCHSDIGYMSGVLTHALAKIPLVLGHEIAGVVTALGEGVTDLAVGDRVAVTAGVTTPGTGSDGGFASLVASPVEYVVRIPDSVSFPLASAASDGGMTAYHAVAGNGQVTAGMNVGIIGLGGLGFIGAQIAAALGASVFVVDPNEAARAAAASFGYARSVADITELADANLDVVIDFAGFGSTTSGAVEIVKQGGRVVQVGLGRAQATIDTSLLVMHEVTLVGSLAGSVSDLEAVIELIGTGSVTPLVTMITFDEIPEGFERLERGEVRGRLVAAISD